MLITQEVLKNLEGFDEETKAGRIKSLFNLNFERNARVILNIIHHDPNKWNEKIAKEIKKMEMKKIKEYKKMQKKMESFNPSLDAHTQSKVGLLNAEIEELQKLLK
jgi:hypothetical protein